MSPVILDNWVCTCPKPPQLLLWSPLEATSRLQYILHLIILRSFRRSVKDEKTTIVVIKVPAEKMTVNIMQTLLQQSEQGLLTQFLLQLLQGGHLRQKRQQHRVTRKRKPKKTQISIQGSKKEVDLNLLVSADRSPLAMLEVILALSSGSRMLAQREATIF